MNKAIVRHRGASFRKLRRRTVSTHFFPRNTNLHQDRKGKFPFLPEIDTRRFHAASKKIRKKSHEADWKTLETSLDSLKKPYFWFLVRRLIAVLVVIGNSVVQISTNDSPFETLSINDLSSFSLSAIGSKCYFAKRFSLCRACVDNALPKSLGTVAIEARRYQIEAISV